MDSTVGRFNAFADVLMLRLSITARTDNSTNNSTDEASRVHYITPFVTDGERLYIFEEPGDRSDELDEMLLGHTMEVSSTATGDLVVNAIGQRPTQAEEAWARDACSARFHYDQALQDLAQLGTVISLA